MNQPLRLHLNENTAGCSPQVIEALSRLTSRDLSIYPDYDQVVGRAARWLRVEPASVALTNGLDEGILSAATTALVGGGGAPEGLIVEPAFEVYEDTIVAAGGAVRAVWLDEAMRLPEQALLDAIGPNTRIVFLNTPHNPTGQIVPADVVRHVASAMPPGGLVLVDEAYADFGGVSFVDQLDRWPNVVVGRTFAKAWGLAALRIGCLVAQPQTIARLSRILPPYRINVCASVALGAALDDVGWVEAYCREVAGSKQLLYETFRRLGLVFWPSEANFVLVRVGERAAEIRRTLAERGVLVRDRSAGPRCAGCLRVSVGRLSETLAAAAAIEEVLCAAA